MVTGISIAIIIVLALVVVYTGAKGYKSTIGGMFVGAFIAIFVGVILAEEEVAIKPIDVYRGKTTLEITYRDSVAVDSIVVWGEETK